MLHQNSAILILDSSFGIRIAVPLISMFSCLCASAKQGHGINQLSNLNLHVTEILSPFF